MEKSEHEVDSSGHLPYTHTAVIVEKQKSVVAAFLLAFLFGPLGLLYASATAGLVMLVLGAVIAVVTVGFGLIFVWIGSVICALVAVNRANARIAGAAGTQAGTPVRAAAEPPPDGRHGQPQPQIHRHEFQASRVPGEALPAGGGTVARPSAQFLGNWARRPLVIGAGLVGGLAILAAAAALMWKTTARVNGAARSSERQSQEAVAAMIQRGATSDPAQMAENKSIIDTYLGTIGAKDFKLFIEKVDGEFVEGYNVAGTNRRPVRGRIANRWTAPGSHGATYTVFKVILTEPGDDEWDGEFNIDLWISDQDRSGQGTWKAFNGRLERTITLREGDDEG